MFNNYKFPWENKVPPYEFRISNKKLVSTDANPMSVEQKTHHPRTPKLVAHGITNAYAFSLKTKKNRTSKFSFKESSIPCYRKHKPENQHDMYGCLLFNILGHQQRVCACVCVCLKERAESLALHRRRECTEYKSRSTWNTNQKKKKVYAKVVRESKFYPILMPGILVPKLVDQWRRALTNENLYAFGHSLVAQVDFTRSWPHNLLPDSVRLQTSIKKNINLLFKRPHSILLDWTTPCVYTDSSILFMKGSYV